MPLATTAILGLLMFSGCRSGSLHNTIVVIPRNTAASFSVTEHAGAAEAARRAHIHVYWNGPSSDADVEQQIVLMERAIRGNALGIIYRAATRKIPVVILGSQIPLTPSSDISFVQDDLRATGLLAAARVKILAPGQGEVGLLGVDPMYAGSVERARAIERAMTTVAPAIRIVAEPAGAFSFDETELNAERMIQAHPRLSVIVGVNVLSAGAALAAVQATGASGRIHVIGLDQGTDLMYLLRTGVLDSLIVQDRRAMAAAAVQNILAQRRGQPVPKRTVFPPMLITRANIDSQNAQNILRMDWRERP
jgi:ribose transport system substrate-binding protein